MDDSRTAFRGALRADRIDQNVSHRASGRTEFTGPGCARPRRAASPARDEGNLLVVRSWFVSYRLRAAFTSTAGGKRLARVPVLPIRSAN
jgi:hypothetical protein